MADLVTGEPRPTSSRLHEVLEAITTLDPSPETSRALSRAAAMVSENGALAQRRAAAGGGALKCGSLAR